MSPNGNGVAHDSALDRLPPNNMLAEQSVMGSIFVDPDILPAVQVILKPADFFYDQHRWMYEATIALQNRSVKIDLVTVGKELEAMGRLDDVGMVYMAQVIAETPTALHHSYYADIVARTAKQRRVITAAGRLAAAAYQADVDLADLAIKASGWLFESIAGLQDDNFYTFQEATEKLYLELVDPTIRPAIKTGLADLDRLLGGLQRGELHLIGGRPGMAKSALGLTIAMNASRFGFLPLLFSMEMGATEVAARMISSQSGLNSVRLRPGVISEDEREVVAESLDVLFEMPGYLDDRPYVSLDDVRLRLRRQQAERPVDLVVIDYLGLMELREGRSERHEAIAKVTRGLKIVAREFDVAMVALAQLNRDAEKQEYPTLANLRDSGALEQDADVVIFLHRDEERYTPEKWARVHPDQPYPKGIADVIVAKNRHGPTAHLRMLFLAEQTKFVALSDDDPDATPPAAPQDSLFSW